MEWCRRGPPMAEVTLVEVVEESLEGSRDFVIID
jgi:hypothetical protein